MHGRVDTEGLAFEPIIEDVETLNSKAFAGELAVTKLSYHAFAHLTAHYKLLDAGSALGKGCGPLLVAMQPMQDAEVNEATIAIPGLMTTANFLLGIAYPNASDKQSMVFSEIEDAVLTGEVGAGLIIHENRFTYAQKGLVQIKDLGAYWEDSTGLPIPLGGIVVKSDLPKAVQSAVNRVMQRSVAYAFAHPEVVMPFVRQYAQSMEPDVMMSHIRLYVNQFTLDLGHEGRTAVQHLFQTARQKGVISDYRGDFFIES